MHTGLSNTLSHTTHTEGKKESEKTEGDDAIFGEIEGVAYVFAHQIYVNKAEVQAFCTLFLYIFSLLLMLLLHSLSVCLHMNVCSLSLGSVQIYSSYDVLHTNNSGHLMGESCYWMVFGWLSSHLAIHFVLFLVIFADAVSHSFSLRRTRTHFLTKHPLSLWQSNLLFSFTHKIILFVII